MGSKLLWTGLTVIVALGKVLDMLNVATADTTIVAVGAIIMVIGLIFKWANK